VEDELSQAQGQLGAAQLAVKDANEKVEVFKKKFQKAKKRRATEQAAAAAASDARDASEAQRFLDGIEDTMATIPNFGTMLGIPGRTRVATKLLAIFLAEHLTNWGAVLTMVNSPTLSSKIATNAGVSTQHVLWCCDFVARLLTLAMPSWFAGFLTTFIGEPTLC